MDLGAALLALLTGLVVKVTVMLLAGRLVLRFYGAAYRAPPRRLWRLLPALDLPHVRLLWWALVLFAVSELTCGVEVYVLLRANVVTSTAHAIASASGMALFALGSYRYADRTLIGFGEPRCLLNRICQGCTIHEPPGCKFRPFLALGVSFLALAALAPLLVPTDSMAADTTRLLLPFPSLNALYDARVVPLLRGLSPDYVVSGEAFRIPAFQFVFEYRVLPLLAFAASLAAIVAIVKRRESAGVQVAALAAGVLGYVYFELVCYRMTGDALLGGLLHEIGEFWFLVIAAELLRLAFGRARRNAGLATGSPATLGETHAVSRT